MNIVLLHGASGNAATFQPVLPTFRGEAVALDLPGRGSTSGAPCATVADTAQWLAGALDGHERPVLVGHSYGGGVALQLALDHPGLLGGLVLVSSASKLRVHPSILEAVAASTVEAPYRLDAAFGPNTPPAVVEQYARDASSVPPATALADWQACDGFDVRDRLSQLDLPVLILHGDSDVLTIPKHQRALEEAIPAATRVQLEGVGHMLPWESPEAFARAVRSFAAVR